MKLFLGSVRCFASIAVHEITNLNPNISNCGRPTLTFLGQINLDDVRIANSHEQCDVGSSSSSKSRHYIDSFISCSHLTSYNMQLQLQFFTSYHRSQLHCIINMERNLLRATQEVKLFKNWKEDITKQHFYLKYPLLKLCITSFG